jgi:hypothetical protein
LAGGSVGLSGSLERGSRLAATSGVAVVGLLAVEVGVAAGCWADGVGGGRGAEQPPTAAEAAIPTVDSRRRRRQARRRGAKPTSNLLQILAGPP